MLEKIRKSIVTLLSMGGIILPQMTRGRWLATLASCIWAYFLFQNPSFELGLRYCVLLMVLHYTVLFGTFTMGEYKEFWLKTSATKEEAHRKFEAWLSFAFFHNGLAFSYSYFATMNQDSFAFALLLSGLWELV